MLALGLTCALGALLAFALWMDWQDDHVHGDGTGTTLPLYDPEHPGPHTWEP